MAGAEEAAAGSIGGAYAGALASGVETISQNQEITFTKYVRVILPLDGFAFWVKADILSPSALIGAMGLATATLAEQGAVLSAAPTMTVKGSLHIATTNNQDETEGFAVNRVIFTSEQDVEELNTVNPSTLYIGAYDDLTFAFSFRRSYNPQSKLWHYQGDAVYPSMASQIIDDPSQLPSDPIVSNSLPIWLALNKFAPMWPSYLVADNIVPPWASVHIHPDSTESMQATAYIDPATGSHYQLTRDRVKITFYGLDNARALDFLDYVNAYSLNTDAIGIMNMPIVRDEKRTQAELNILAMKKTIEFEVSYYQQTVRSVALNLIRSAFISDFFPQGGIEPAPPLPGPGLTFNLAGNSQYIGLLAGI